MKPILLFLSVVLAAQDGAALYKRHCAGCHDGAAERVPPFAALKAMPVSGYGRWGGMPGNVLLAFSVAGK